MPLSAGTTYGMLHECLGRAYDIANEASPDPELDLQGMSEPQWGHHSMRRGADTMARETRHLTGASEQDIDIIFGWNEAMYAKNMQTHYESNFTREKRCIVTSRI